MSEQLLFPLLKTYIKQDKNVTLAVVVRGPDKEVGKKAVIPLAGEAIGPLLDLSVGELVANEVRGLMLDRSDSMTRRYQNDEYDELEIFFDIHKPAPKLIIVGAVHIADSLMQFALPLGFRTHLVDPRTAFATHARFPHVDEMHHQWPDEALPEIGINNETAVVVITHDPKLDDPALKVALPSLAYYVGALGSPKTHTQRVDRLLAEGVSQAELDRLHAPIGLNIGGRSPAEIGLSIMAQIIAIRNKRLTSSTVGRK